MSDTPIGVIEFSQFLLCCLAITVGPLGLYNYAPKPVQRAALAWMIFWAIPAAWILLRWYFRLMHFLWAHS